MTGKPQYEDRDWELDDHDWSEKAWMSVTDADLFEALLLRMAESGEPLEILEWGSGRSTLYYAGMLTDAGVPFRWLSLEYDRGYFETDLEPELDRLPHPRVVRIDDDGRASERDLGAERRASQSVDLVVFDKGTLRPMLRAHKEDRGVDMDAYVAFPARQGRRYHVVLVDGRKRRRCLIEASRMLTRGGVTLLHDAWRPYYGCAFEHYESDRRIGNILRIGSLMPDAALDGLLNDLDRITVA